MPVSQPTSRGREHVADEQSRFKCYRENGVSQWRRRGLFSIQV